MAMSKEARLNQLLIAARGAGYETLDDLKHELKCLLEHKNYIKFFSLLAAVLTVGCEICVDDFDIIADRNDAQKTFDELYDQGLFFDAIIVAAMVSIVFKNFQIVGWNEKRATLRQAARGGVAYFFDNNLRDYSDDKLFDFYMGFLLLASLSTLGMDVCVIFPELLIEHVIGEIKKKGYFAESFVMRACWLKLKYKGMILQ